MHLPLTVLTIALAVSIATALPGWRSKTSMDDVKCETGTCTHGGNYQKGQGWDKEFYQQRQYEPRSERGGRGTRGAWLDDEGMDLMSTGNDRVVGNDHGAYDNGIFIKGGDDFYQGGDKKGGFPVLTTRNFHNMGRKMRLEKEEAETPHRIEYAMGGGGLGRLFPRHVDNNENEGDSELLSYFKGGLVGPRNFHSMGKMHYETGDDRLRFWARQIEDPITGDDFVRTKPTEGGDEFVAGRRLTKTDNFANIMNQGGDDFNTRGLTKVGDLAQLRGDDDFYTGGLTKVDDLAQLRGDDDFYTGGLTKVDDLAQIRSDDDFYTGSRNKGGDELDFFRGQRGGIRS